MDHLDTFAGRVRGPLTALTLLFALAGPAAAQDPTPAAAGQDTARIHEVRPGDTLWDLSQFYYGTPWEWPRIHAANTGLVANPHLILPSWRLTIPGIAPERAAGLLGEPVEIGVQPAEPAPVTPIVEMPVEQEPVPVPERTVFYPRDERTMLVAEDFERALVSPGEHYAAAWLTEGRPIPVLGVIADRFGRQAPGQVLAETAHPYSQLYLSYGPEARPEIGQRLMAVRTLRDVEGYGTIIEPRGILQVVSLDAEVITTVVVQQFGQLQVGDLAVPIEPAPDLLGREVAQLVSGAEGSLLTFVEPQPVYGTQDHAFVTLGSAQGVGVGDELIVILPPRPVRGEPTTRLPAEVVARLRVLRVGERTSTTKIIQLTEPVLEPGMPVRLVGQVQ